MIAQTNDDFLWMGIIMITTQPFQTIANAHALAAIAVLVLHRTHRGKRMKNPTGTSAADGVACGTDSGSAGCRGRLTSPIVVASFLP
jgi:hypothetical protein